MKEKEEFYIVKCKLELNGGDLIVRPGTVVSLTEAEAREPLKFGRVIPAPAEVIKKVKEAKRGKSKRDK